MKLCHDEGCPDDGRPVYRIVPKGTPAKAGEGWACLEHWPEGQRRPDADLVDLTETIYKG